MTRLPALQAEFAAALRATEGWQAPAYLAPDHAARFRIYRNNVRYGLSEALGEAYPVVKRLVGDAFFSGMARAFLAEHPPRRRSLSLFGAGFADFVSGLEVASRLPYLADVATLERAVLEALHAADAPALSPEAVLLQGEDVAHARAVLHPATRLVQVRYPVDEIWRAHQQATVQPLQFAEGACAVLVTRPGLSALLWSLDSSEAEFLRALMAGRAFVDAYGAVGDLDATAAFARLLTAGALQALEFPGNAG